MTSKRIRKRIRETTEVYNTSVDESTRADLLKSKPDADLFQIDRVGSKAVRRKVNKEILPKSRGEFLSATESKLIERMRNSSVRKEKDNQNSEIVHDLWGNDEAVVRKDDSKELDIHSNGKSRVKSSRPNSKSIRIPVPGLSVNPSTVDHQQALAEALALQLKKDKEMSDKIISEPINDVNDCQNESEDESDSNSSDSEYSNSNGVDSSEAKPRKQRKKLTRAQRNKLRNRNIARNEKLTQQKKLELLNSVEQAPALLDAIKKEEQIRKSLKDLHKTRKHADQKTEQKRMSYLEAGAVPLSDELEESAGSLRRLRPKSVPVEQVFGSMQRSGAASRKEQRNRRAYEKPHGAKKQVWIPKYKHAKYIDVK